jgi:hypothetical protein
MAALATLTHFATDGTTRDIPIASEFQQARSRHAATPVLASSPMRTWCSQGRLAAVLVIAAVGCGSSDQTGDGGVDAPSLCGDAAPCSAAQVCVSLQNCGTPQCLPVPDAGGCPAGSSATASCPGTGQPGCVGGCPATFTCEARPATCSSTVDCTCAASLCAPGTCIATMGNKVACQGF